MCDCAIKVRDKLKETTGDPNVFIDGIGWKVGLQIIMSCEYSYRKLTKAGKRSKHHTYQNLIFSFCPFCGKKY